MELWPLENFVWGGLALAPIIGILQGWVIKYFVPGEARRVTLLFCVALSIIVALLSGWLFSDQSWFFASLLFGWWLIPLALIDFKALRLPDFLTLPLIPLGFVATYFLQLDQVLWHLAGAIAGAGAFYLVARIFHKIRGIEGLGMGDVKFVTGLGAWVGLSALPSLIFLASILGIGYALVMQRSIKSADKNLKIPFGVFLATAGWVVWLTGPLDVVFFG